MRHQVKAQHQFFEKILANDNPHPKFGASMTSSLEVMCKMLWSKWPMKIYQGLKSMTSKDLNRQNKLI